MDRRRHAATIIQGASAATIVAGLWLIIAPAALGYSALTGPFRNDLIVGGALAVLGLIRFKAPLTAPEGVGWLKLTLGAWLACAPFALDYTEDTVLGVTAEAAYRNDIVVGGVVLALAAMGNSAAKRAAAVLPVETERRPALTHGGSRGGRA